METCPRRQINPHGHNRPVGRDDIPSAGRCSRHNKFGSDLGSHTQSTAASEKCAASGTKSVHQVDDSHNGAITVVEAPSFCNFRQTRPNNM